MTQWFNVAKIVNTHGIHGEVRVISRTDFPEERYATGQTLYLFLPEQHEPIPLIVKSHRKHKNFDLLRFEEYTNINQVEHWKNGILKVQEEQLLDLPDGEYYYYEIIGSSVYTSDGDLVGVVKEILSPGANDVWVVRSNNGKEYLIPYIEEIVKKINVNEKKILIDPMEGLLS